MEDPKIFSIVKVLEWNKFQKYNYYFNYIFEEGWIKDTKYFQNIKVLKIFNIVTFVKYFLKKDEWKIQKYKSIRMK